MGGLVSIQQRFLIPPIGYNLCNCVPINSKRFQTGEGSGRGHLCECEIFANHRSTHLPEYSPAYPVSFKIKPAPPLEVRAGVPKQFPFLRILNVLQEHRLQCVMCIYSSIQSVCEHLMCSGGPPKTDRNRGCFHMYLILNLDSCVLCFAALHSLRNAIACHRLQSHVCLV